MASRRPRAVVLASVALLSSSFVLRKSPPLRGARTSPAPARAAHRPPAHAREPRALYTRCYADASSRSDNGTRDDEFNVEPPKRKEETTALALTEDASTNPYYKVVASLSPGEIIGRFAATAPPRVQDAVKQTIMGLLGNAGSFALETATVTTSEKLANLMFQLQMTGYMFKNAEYRLSLSRSLEGVPALPPGDFDTVEDLYTPPEVSGQVTVNVMGEDVSIDADAYMAELREEVSTLRRELDTVEKQRREAAQSDLLAYVRSLPEQQMAALTSEITDDVLDGMKKLVYSIMKGMGTSTVETETLLQQSGSAMAQLCMWQLAIGYNLRELEVRDQLQKQLGAGEADDAGDDGGGEA